jgi:pteridine reductase
VSTKSVAPASRPLALVTGGAQRLGAQIVQALHAQGMNIALHYCRSQRAAQDLQQALNVERAQSCSLVHADLAEPQAAAALASQVASTWGRLDLLVNNAAVFTPTPLGATPLEAWNAMLDTNLRAPFLLIQALLALLRESRGLVVNMVDIYAERPRAGYAAYNASKAGLVGLTKALARDLAPAVRVNAVAPGAILWHAAASDQEQASILARTPLGRLGKATDIVAAIQYLIDAPYVTGQVLTVDGGRSVMD